MRLHSLANVIYCLIAAAFLLGCQPFNTPPLPAVSTLIETPIEIQESYLTETPVPACVSLPDVKLRVDILSKNSVRMRITGLVPNEPVYIILSSAFD